MVLDIRCGNSLSVLPLLESNSVHSIVTDPPYELGFMGKTWDSSGIAYNVDLWRECLRVLKPGGHLLSFGGSRTYHRMACAIEDAGFEIRDQIMWIYSQGFPKSLDVSKAIDKAAGADRDVVGMGRDQKSMAGGAYGSDWSDRVAQAVTLTAPATDAAKQWDGWGTALKPAHEPICVARKPLIGTVAANVLAHGCGALNIDGCRVGEDGGCAGAGAGAGAGARVFGNGLNGSFAEPVDGLGRWPANIVIDEGAAVLIDEKSGHLQIGRPMGVKAGNNNNVFGQYAGGIPVTGIGDSGGASRFYKTAEWSTTELIFCRARAIIEAWSPDLANTANNHSCLSNEHVGSVLSDAVCVASQGAKRLSALRGLSTTVSPSELRAISETVIAMILSSENEFSPDQRQERHFLNGCLARVAEIQKLTGTTTITISLWRSGGFAGDATLDLTWQRSEHGERDSERTRFIYCAKASAEDRGWGNDHPTVKPHDLMRWLVRLVTPPGGTVLDPFCGSGSTGKACVREGFGFVGIDLSEHHCEIARRRCGSVTGALELFTPEVA